MASKEKRRAIKAHCAQISDELKRPRDFYESFKPFLSDKTKEEAKLPQGLTSKL